MAVKASATITIFNVDDIAGTTRYYKLVTSGSSAPSKPADNTDPDSTWTKTEPTVDTSKVLYFVDQTLWSNGAKTYSEVSKSSSYEAAKEAYNKAAAASDTAQAAQDGIDNLEIGGRNLLLSSADLTKWRIEGGTYCTLQDDGYFKIEKPGLANSRFGIYCFLTLEPNTTYSFSADVKDICGFGVQKSTTPEPSAWGNAIIYESTSRYKNTEFIKTGEDDYYVKVYIYHRGGDPCSYVKLPKLEKGNRATDWTPAPEDVDADINEAAKTATDYLKFNNGLIVAKDAANWSSGRNVFINDDSVNIRKGSLIYAKYGENIELYTDQYDGNTASPAFILGKDTLIDELKNNGNNYAYTESSVDYPIASGSNITIKCTATTYLTLNAGPFLYEIYFATSLKTIYLLANIPNQITNVKEVYWNSDNKTKIFIGTCTDGTNVYHTEYPIAYLDNDCKQVLNGNLWIENTGDANGFGYPAPPLGIGTKDGEHLEIDANEIMAKSDEYTPSHLFLNQEGGNVSINNNCRRSVMFQNGAMFARNLDAFEEDDMGKWLGIVDGINETGNTTFAYGNWLNSVGLTNIYGNGINLITQNLPIGVDTGTPDGTKDTTKKIMLSKTADGYYGLVNPDGSDDSYVRSPQSGIIPYASGGNETHGLTTKIGTETWPFYSGYFEYLYVTNWIKVGGTKVSLEGHGHAWSEITGKPSSYPPESHHHTAVYSADDSANVFMGTDTNYYFRPSTNTASPYTYLGSSSHKWKQLYATTTTINTSDLKEKRDVEKLDDKYIQMFDLIEPYSYKTINGDRVHTGFIAQYVEDAMEQVGLTIEELGFLCKDARNIEEEDEHGNILSKTPVLDEDGNQIYDYGLRYSEYIAICVAKIKQQEKRINELEAKLDSILEKLGEQ